jgi:EpsI family protein
VLVAGCLLISDIREQASVPLAAPLTTLAAGIDGYTVRDVIISEDERRVAGMSDYSMRVYERAPASSFSVYVGYYDSQVQGKTIHSPRNCLPGAGWETLQGGTRVLASSLDHRFTVNRYVLMNGPRQALVYYWYQGRGRLESNEYRVKWNLLRDAALSGRTEEALVRIVVPLPRVSPADTVASSRAYAAADDIAERVARRLVDEVDRVLPAPYGVVARVATTSVTAR